MPSNEEYLAIHANMPMPEKILKGFTPLSDGDAIAHAVESLIREGINAHASLDRIATEAAIALLELGFRRP